MASGAHRFTMRAQYGEAPDGRRSWFHVIDAAGNVVGVVAETHDAGVRYMASSDRGEAQFRSYGHKSPKAAFTALLPHLATLA